MDILDDFDENEDMEDSLEMISMIDEDGNEVEFAILDAKEHNDVVYLLVIEAEMMDDEDAEASILKVVSSEGDDMIYEFIDDDNEFDMAAGLFSDDEDYDIE